MSEENFSTLIPQRNDSVDIVRLKHAQAAARLIEPAAVPATILEVTTCLQVGWDWDWRPAVSVPTYFRKALVWGASLDGHPNTTALRLRYGANANRIINPGEMIVIEAMPGQKLNLADFLIFPSYQTDVFTFELY